MAKKTAGETSERSERLRIEADIYDEAHRIYNHDGTTNFARTLERLDKKIQGEAEDK